VSEDQNSAIVDPHYRAKQHPPDFTRNNPNAPLSFTPPEPPTDAGRVNPVLFAPEVKRTFHTRSLSDSDF
jgi:hypothetical protein